MEERDYLPSYPLVGKEGVLLGEPHWGCEGRGLRVVRGNGTGGKKPNESG